jgi:hypothetical protein
MKKTLIPFMLVSVIAVTGFFSCASAKPLHPTHSVKNADEDEFFALTAGILSQDRTHEYQRVKGEDLDEKVLKLIQNEVLRTEGTYALGLVYESNIAYNDTTYALFFMDTTTARLERVVMDSGKPRQLDLGERICKWILYKTTPRAAGLDDGGPIPEQLSGVSGTGYDSSPDGTELPSVPMNMTPATPPPPPTVITTTVDEGHAAESGAEPATEPVEDTETPVIP